MPGERPSHPSLSDIYEEHLWGVYGFFGYHRLSRQDAEDLTQTTFERAFRAWPRYDPARATVKTWLLAIARNLLIDHHRRERPRRVSSLDAAGSEDAWGVSTSAEHSPGCSPELERALDRLTTREREVIALRFGGDLSGPEIATTLGLSLANVQQIASRSLRKLRAELEQGSVASVAVAGARRGPTASVPERVPAQDASGAVQVP